MSLAVIYSRAKVGIEAPLVHVEVHLSNGLPSFSIVGLPETAVKESKDRVRSAIINSGYDFPASRITVNLAPADLPKEGGRFDLAIALGILAASEQLPDKTLDEYECIGELALTGAIRKVDGVIPAALAASKAQRTLILPSFNLQEASLSKCPALCADHLLKVCRHLSDEKHLTLVAPLQITTEQYRGPDMAQVKGQHHARRALEIAAAGNHNLLFSGPPGSGKSMLAHCLPGILPPLNETEALEVAALYSVSRHPQRPYFLTRPFRQPHHTSSGVALVGGGAHPKPGEISLAHHGVLFLDEIPEFSRSVLDVMREPLETGRISISRAAQQVEYPANFQLIAAMNPCPCGYLKQANKRCADCSEAKALKYQSSVSGPLLDRIDIQIEVPALPKGLLSSSDTLNETSQQVRARVTKARTIQQNRQNGPNAQLDQKAMAEICALSKGLSDILENALDKLGLSARAYHRILKVARTVADLAGCQQIERSHLLEALSYRQLERRLNPSQAYADNQ
jgi:magnesium chelatase family protein